jgi:predicted dehydrogenase
MTQLTRRSLVAGAGGAALAAETAGTVRLPRKVRLAMIGFNGHAGEILNPLPNLPDVELTAICETSGEGPPRNHSQRIAGARKYTDYRRMLDAEKPDAVGICTVNSDRTEPMIACIERKIPCIAEKPIVLSRADLTRLRAALERNPVPISMLLPMRFASPYRALKKIVDSGEIGEVANISAQKSYKAGNRAAWMRKRATYAGTIPWIGIHMIDLMRWASGRDFTEACSYQHRTGGFPGIGEMENTTASIFRLDNGGVGNLHMDYFRPETAPSHGDDRLRLAGTKGVAEYQASTGVTLLTEGRKPEQMRDLPAAGSVFLDFLEAAFAGKPAALTVADILRVSLIVVAAQESAVEHRMVKV